jgi:hypothetical protein
MRNRAKLKAGAIFGCLSLLASSVWADPYAPDRTKNKVQVVLREADLNRLSGELASRGYLGITRVPFIFNWNEMVSSALKLIYQEGHNTQCESKAGNLGSLLSDPMQIRSLVLDNFTTLCRDGFLYSAAINSVLSLYLPVSPSMPVPLSIVVKSLQFDFQTGNKVIVTAVVSLQINTEVASVTLVADANPGFDNQDALLLFSKDDKNKMGLKLCLNQLAFKITNFNLSYSNAYLKTAASALIQQQLDKAKADIGPEYCTDLIAEVTPPPKFFGNALNPVRPRIYVNDTELILETEVLDVAPVINNINTLLLGGG